MPSWIQVHIMSLNFVLCLAKQPLSSWAPRHNNSKIFWHLIWQTGTDVAPHKSLQIRRGSFQVLKTWQSSSILRRFWRGEFDSLEVTALSFPFALRFCFQEFVHLLPPSVKIAPLCLGSTDVSKLWTAFCVSLFCFVFPTHETAKLEQCDRTSDNFLAP